jgi:hypothetical protein
MLPLDSEKIQRERGENSPKLQCYKGSDVNRWTALSVVRVIVDPRKRMYLC